MRALRIIKYCAIIFSALIVAGEAYLFVAVRGKDDIAGGVAIGLFMIFISVVIATAAGVFERNLKSSVGMKSENNEMV